GMVKSSLTQNVAVTIDSPTVEVAVTRPAAGVVKVGEGGTDIAVQAATTPGFGQRRATWAVAGPNGWSASGGTAPSPDGRLFSSSVRLPATPLGRFTVTMT